MEAPSKSFQNYSKLGLLLSEGTKRLQKRFFSRWKEVFGSDWTDDTEAGKFFQSGNGLAIKKKMKKLQQVALTKGESSSWDLSLLGVVLTCPPFNVKRFRKNIDQILEIRNKISHLPDWNIPNDTYAKLLAKLSSTLQVL